MRSLRILIATHSPLAPEFGAGQMAINLAAAFRAQGHDVTLWSPHPILGQTRWWQGLQSLQLMRTKLDEFLTTQKPFDVIDCYAPFITNQVSKSGLVVARSVQPDILYIISNLNNPQKTKEILLLPFGYLFTIINIFLLLQGWGRAKYILCLGSLELQWMRKCFPWWRSKLFSYNNALSKAEQAELAQVRLNRKRNETESTRFLWIGRWVAHKGVKELVDFIVKRATSHPQDSFTIAGCGTSAEKDFPSKLIQSGQLKILPSFERSQLIHLLANHDTGLFTSRVEGWGLVLNEMLESGMPIFATLAGGVLDLQPFFEDMLRPFPPTIQKISEKLIISKDMDNYYSTFSWEKTVDNYVKFLLNGKNYNTNPTK
ncbi:glycosyltransferase family 4 protein [Nostocaceae cyanobacterium CENA357]|uniref:Glycosyltransferase family 4 protein n=1 Tax=Atlanticothrix silvestris CENA357 TaxID=1725252 RepID=A0A8J7L635_9CYAN|nr:glycosyltransferase family 4 protein [Atlanticothrix silvestris]MBH8555302.1 glycosyltransferase family 4 protein [Atlanticothrix silvestris CENA357]